MFFVLQIRHPANVFCNEYLLYVFTACGDKMHKKVSIKKEKKERHIWLYDQSVTKQSILVILKARGKCCVLKNA